jgi:hypothetical protein
MHTTIYDFVTGFRKRQEMHYDCLHFERNITLKAPNERHNDIINDSPWAKEPLQSKSAQRLRRFGRNQ